MPAHLDTQQGTQTLALFFKIFHICIFIVSYSFRWRKRIKTDDHNRLLKTNMAVHYHTSAVIQSPMPWACAGM